MSIDHLPYAPGVFEVWNISSRRCLGSDNAPFYHLQVDKISKEPTSFTLAIHKDIPYLYQDIRSNDFRVTVFCLCDNQS